MQTSKILGKILGVSSESLDILDSEMRKRTSRRGVLEDVANLNMQRTRSVLQKINSGGGDAAHVRGCLRRAIYSHEKQFISLIEKFSGETEFEKAAHLAKKIARVGKGFFLKKEKAREILEMCPPENLLKFLGYTSIKELFSKEDIDEILSALRFIESNEWMHKTFDVAYKDITPRDFEDRPVELKVMGAKWMDIGKKFAEKKHHNVSHLKEFGVIFLNPIKMDIPGKFIRDFALLLHYFHEVEFYSNLFRSYKERPDFSAKLMSLLRGDVPEPDGVGPGEWLIIQRYLWKENPDDKRLFLPRVNPESLHWARGERDFARFALEYDDFDGELWHDLDWVGEIFEEDGKKELVSFDLEDTVMSLVSFMEGREEFFTYHQREAMWTKIFSEYVGGEEEMERLLIENFDKGKIIF